MNNNNRPEAYGVFKPVGHVLASFPTDADARGALAELVRSGFADDSVSYYSPEQMKQQADLDIGRGGVLSTIGQELNLVKAHRELAAQGYSFLLVRAPYDADAQKVAAIVSRFHASRAQKYGRLLIEELIDVGHTENQLPESPDLGLDAQTRSGREGAGGKPGTGVP